MRISAKEFKALPRKTITFIGMSGSGKTHISSQLEKWGWEVYSCDYEIGSKSLKDELVGLGAFSADDVGALSGYIGKLGNPDKGGFLLDKFKARQKTYYDAEIVALYAVGDALNATSRNFVNDSTGSLCEVEDENLMQKLGAETLFVYLKTGEQEDKEVLQRASDYPKPLFFPQAFLAEKLAEFLSEFNISSIDKIEPNNFARWVFPLLFQVRKPKYQRLADLYGVTIMSSEFRDLKSEGEFLGIIERHLD